MNLEAAAGRAEKVLAGGDTAERAAVLASATVVGTWLYCALLRPGASRSSWFLLINVVQEAV